MCLCSWYWLMGGDTMCESNCLPLDSQLSRLPRNWNLLWPQYLYQVWDFTVTVLLIETWFDFFYKSRTGMPVASRNNGCKMSLLLLRCTSKYGNHYHYIVSTEYLCRVLGQCELSGQWGQCYDGLLRGHGLDQLLPRRLHCLGVPDWTSVETLVHTELSLVQHLSVADMFIVNILSTMMGYVTMVLLTCDCL